MGTHGGTTNQVHSSTLSFPNPAEMWNEALPIGNGRLGAMVYGRPATELLQLNEDSVYSGGKQERTPTQACQYLPRLRQLIREGQHERAEELVKLAFIPTPSSQRHYEPLATVSVAFGNDDMPVTGYTRSLDLLTGVTSTEFKRDDVSWCRELIASHEHEALVTRIRSSCKSRFIVRLSRFGENEWDTNEFCDTIESVGDKLIMQCSSGIADGIKSCCALAARCDAGGSLHLIGGSLVVEATETYIVVAAQTTFRHVDPVVATLTDIDNAMRLGLSQVWTRHLASHCELMSRMRLTFRDNVAGRHSPIPDDNIDTHLIERYHNHGRYLLASSSRGLASKASLSLPSNLQGIWNPSFSPPWGCRFTININTQMNYWPCHIWNLSACSDPLFHLLLRMAERGKKTAREVYGCTRPGAWCAHHNTDLWADTDPVDRWMPSALWPLGGAWLCLHMSERYEFNGDHDLLDGEPFLEKMLPVMEGAILFLLDFTIPADHHEQFLVTSPSLSPENSYWVFKKAGTKVKGTFCEGSTIDIQIIQALFCAYLALTARSRATTTRQDSTRTEVQAALSRLPPLQIGKDGRLLEWQQPYEECEPGHRHFSHLFPLYPGNTITPSGTPELAEACRKTLQKRLAEGSAHTGWSRAWLICLYARLHDSEECLKHLKLMLSTSALPNLFSNHPPMQIDGNFGACAGILEMLVQSHETIQDGIERPMRVIRVLPACPSSWLESGGCLKGVRCRGGFELMIEWCGVVSGQSTVQSEGRESATVILPDGTSLEVPQWEEKWTISQLRERLR